MEKILFTGINIDDLLEKIGQVIDKKLSKVSIPNISENQPNLSRKEVANLLKISLPTLNEWTKLGWLQSRKMGNRVWYKRAEVEQALEKAINQKHKRNTLMIYENTTHTKNNFLSKNGLKSSHSRTN